MALVAEAVYHSFEPRKLNYELLGNTDNHMHWHLFPRYKDDPDPKRAVWVIDRSIRSSENVKPSTEDLEKLRNTLLKHFKE